MNDEEQRSTRDQWIDALNVAGRPITAVDVEAQKYKLHELSASHETCVYEYLKFKINNQESFDEILKIGPTCKR